MDTKALLKDIIDTTDDFLAFTAPLRAHDVCCDALLSTPTIVPTIVTPQIPDCAPILASLGYSTSQIQSLAPIYELHANLAWRDLRLDLEKTWHELAALPPRREALPSLTNVFARVQNLNRARFEIEVRSWLVNCDSVQKYLRSSVDFHSILIEQFLDNSNPDAETKLQLASRSQDTSTPMNYTQIGKWFSNRRCRIGKAIKTCSRSLDIESRTNFVRELLCANEKTGAKLQQDTSLDELFEDEDFACSSEISDDDCSDWDRKDNFAAIELSIIPKPREGNSASDAPAAFSLSSQKPSLSAEVYESAIVSSRKRKSSEATIDSLLSSPSQKRVCVSRRKWAKFPADKAPRPFSLGVVENISFDKLLSTTVSSPSSDEIISSSVSCLAFPVKPFQKGSSPRTSYRSLAQIKTAARNFSIEKVENWRTASLRLPQRAEAMDIDVVMDGLDTLSFRKRKRSESSPANASSSSPPPNPQPSSLSFKSQGLPRRRKIKPIPKRWPATHSDTSLLSESNCLSIISTPALSRSSSTSSCDSDSGPPSPCDLLDCLEEKFSAAALPNQKAGRGNIGEDGIAVIRHSSVEPEIQVQVEVC